MFWGFLFVCLFWFFFGGGGGGGGGRVVFLLVLLSVAKGIQLAVLTELMSCQVNKHNEK